MRRTGRQSYLTIKNGRSFIRPIIPFVGYFRPQINPFICNLIPSVRFRHFYLAGFTLIELIVTVTIVAILATVVAPAMRNFILEQRLSSQTNEFIADLNLARSEAIRRAEPVTVCKSNNATDADPGCDTDAASPWTPGRVVFVDRDGDGSIDLGGGTPDEILRVRGQLEGADTSGNRLLLDSATGLVAITFRANGTVASATGASDNQFILCDNRGGSYARAIVISGMGRVRVAERGKDVSGNNINCN